MHLGDLELDAIGARLFAEDLEVDGADSYGVDSRGDGVLPTDIVKAPPLTEQEFRALRWKCGLKKAPPETILAIAEKLPPGPSSRQ